MWLALATVGISVVGIVVQVVLRIANPDSARSGITTVLVVVLFIGGVHLLCLSIIGSYLAHIYDEVKRRPAYIVESVLNDPRSARRDIAEPAESTSIADS